MLVAVLASLVTAMIVLFVSLILLATVPPVELIPFSLGGGAVLGIIVALYTDLLK